jgi:hypothetical protein
MKWEKSKTPLVFTPFCARYWPPPSVNTSLYKNKKIFLFFPFLFFPLFELSFVFEFLFSRPRDLNMESSLPQCLWWWYTSLLHVWIPLKWKDSDVCVAWSISAVTATFETGRWERDQGLMRSLNLCCKVIKACEHLLYYIYIYILVHTKYAIELQRIPKGSRNPKSRSSFGRAVAWPRHYLNASCHTHRLTQLQPHI